MQNRFLHLSPQRKRRTASTAALLASLMIAGAHAADLPHLSIDHGDSYTPSVEHDVEDRAERHDTVELIDGSIVAGSDPFSDEMEVTTLFTARKGDVAIRLFGGADFEKVGSDLVTLSAQSDYTGLTYVAEGTLRTNVANAFSKSEGFAVEGGAVFDINGKDQYVNGSVFLGNGGRLEDSSGTGFQDRTAVLTAACDFLLYEGSVDLVLGGDVDLYKYDAGMVSLNNRNLFTGDVYVFEGVLRVTVDSAIAKADQLFVAEGTFDTFGTAQRVEGEIVLIDGTLDDSSSDKSGTLSSGIGEILLQNGDVNVNIVDDVTGGPTNVFQNGFENDVTRLNVQNHYTGETVVMDGRLQTTVDDALAFSSLLEVSDSGSFDTSGTTQHVNEVLLLGGSLDDTSAGKTGMIISANGYHVVAGAVNVALGGDSWLYKSGDETVEINVANRYTGGTYVAAGRLDLYAVDAIPFASDLYLIDSDADVFMNGNVQSLGSLAIAEGSRLDLGAGGLTDLNVGLKDGNGVIAGRISGSGYLEKHGAGELLVEGNILISEAVNVRSGLLTLAENETFNIGFGGVNVYNGAVMQGTGNVLGAVYNNGVFRPGDGNAGIIDVGSYVQGPDGTFVVNFNAEGKTGQLVSFDAVHLAGRLHVIQGGYDVKSHEAFEIIHSEDSIVSRFDEVVSDLKPILTLVVDYQEDSVWLRFLRRSFLSLAETPNQRSVARALDRAQEKGQLEKMIDRLDQSELSDIPDLLSLLSPESMSAIFQVGFAAAQIQHTNIERRLDDIRAGSTGFSAGGFSLRDAHGSVSADGMLMATHREGLTLAGWDGKSLVSRESVAPVMEESRWGFFVTGSGEWADIESTSQAKGGQFNSGGLTIGADYRVNEHFIVGLSAGYAHTGADLAYDGKIEANGGRGSLYGTLFGGGAYLNASVGGGYNSYRIKRGTLGGTAHGDTDGGEFNALLGGGYDYKLGGGFTIGPIASATYTYLGVSGYRENGSAAPLDLAKNSQDSLRSALGVKLAFDWQVGGLRVRPEVRAQWKHEFLDTKAVIDSSFVGAGAAFSVEGPDIGRDSLVLDAGATLDLNPAVSLFAYYSGEIGRRNYQSHSVNGGFSLRF